MGCCMSFFRHPLPEIAIASDTHANTPKHSIRHVSLRVYEVLTPSQIEEYRKRKMLARKIIDPYEYLLRI